MPTHDRHKTRGANTCQVYDQVSSYTSSHPIATSCVRRLAWEHLVQALISGIFRHQAIITIVLTMRALQCLKQKMQCNTKQCNTPGHNNHHCPHQGNALRSHTVQCKAIQCNLVMHQSATVLSGKLWQDVALCCTMLYDVARCCTVWYDVVRCVKMWHDVAHCGMVVLCGSDNHWLGERNQAAKHSGQRMLLIS